MFVFPCVYISGGNQRDLARQKAQKKAQDAKKGVRNDGLTVEQRKQRFVSKMSTLSFVAYHVIL